MNGVSAEQRKEGLPLDSVLESGCSQAAQAKEDSVCRWESPVRVELRVPACLGSWPKSFHLRISTFLMFITEPR